MDSDQTANLNQTWTVDGHGDTFVISPNCNDTINISGGSLAPGYGAVHPATMTWPNTSPTYTFGALSATSPPSGRITLTGADADIEINGESVVSMLREIRDRLNILQVSKEMEAEWAELRVLREQYEAKLAECREKSSMWKALKHTDSITLP
jgi:hypothetical protein